MSTIEATLLHAMFLARHLSKCGLRYAVVAILLELGIPTHQDGYDYLKKAIILLCENPNQEIMKQIYPTVGSMCKPEIGASSVEQAIRSAIAKAWRNRDDEVWAIFFPPGRDGKIRKPTNSEFMTKIVCFLELWEGCCKEVCYEGK